MKPLSPEDKERLSMLQSRHFELNDKLIRLVIAVGAAQRASGVGDTFIERSAERDITHLVLETLAIVEEQYQRIAL